MDSLDKDIQQLKALNTFLKMSFKGSSFNDLKADEAIKSLDKVIKITESNNSLFKKSLKFGCDVLCVMVIINVIYWTLVLYQAYG